MMRNQLGLSLDGKHYMYDATIGPLSPAEMEPMVSFEVRRAAAIVNLETTNRQMSLAA